MISNFSEIIGELSSNTISSTLSTVSRSFGIRIASSSALTTSIAVLVSNGTLSKIKIRYAKLGGWINLISLPYEKTLKQ